MAIVGVRLSPRALRFAAAGLVVLVVAVSVWLFGRPAPPPPTVAVVAATEPWAAGHAPGDFTTIEVPASAARLFVTPAGLDGRVPAVPIPAGAVLSSAMLADPAAAASNPEATLVAVGVDLSLWPPPGPAPGDTAVLASNPGGCASAALPVVATTDTQLVVEANPEVAALVAGGEWVAWKSPAAGWPQCQAAVALAPSDPEATLVAVGVDLSLWPPPGPAPGDTAVLASNPGGCASAALPVVATTDTQLVVEANPEVAALVAGGEWVAWKSPAAGWPQCQAAVALAPSDPEATLVAVGVDLSLWPPPGPAPGDTAVLASNPGGCASAALPVVATTDTQLVVEANPEVAALLADTDQWIAWKSPPAGWPECDIDPATASDPEATLVAVGVDLSLWPPPGPAPGDTAVLSWHPGGCAAAVLPVLAATVDRLVVEVTPVLAEELGPYQWWAWEAPAEQWPRCERPIDAAGVN